jgi:Domain of unknown function (DUF4382)
MRFPPISFQTIFCCAVIFLAVGMSGCGNSCYAGYSINGNGGFIVVAGNPPPACSIPKVNSTMRVAALKSPICEACMPATRVEHVFVTLHGVQLLPLTSDDTNSPDWLELTPQLAKEPRQIDLVGNSFPVILQESTSLAAGNYREVRLQFVNESSMSAETLPSENACGRTLWNCIVMADGNIQPLRLPADGSELSISSPHMESGPFVVLPETAMELQLSLESHPRAYFSIAEGWTLRNVLAGHATVAPQHAMDTSLDLSGNPDALNGSMQH